MTETKNDSPPTLSICVPTFQREKWIASLLEQFDREIRDVASGDVEVCIIDNASGDEFWAFLTRMKQPRDWLRIQRNRSNVGIEGNIVQSLLASRGIYTWLLSDHQKLRPGVLRQTLSILHEHQPDLVCMTLKSWRVPLRESLRIMRLGDLSIKERSALLFTFGNMSTELFRSELARDHMRLAVRISWFNYPNMAFVRSWKTDTTVIQVPDATELPELVKGSLLKKSYDPFEASFINNLECISRLMAGSELTWSRRHFQNPDYIRALGVQIILIWIGDIDRHDRVFFQLLRAVWVNRVAYGAGVCSLLCGAGALISLLPRGLRTAAAKFVLSVGAPHSQILVELNQHRG